jgi:hypothetical protein
VLGYEVEEAVVPGAAADELLAVEVAAGFPGGDGFERGGLRCCDEPLYDAEMRVTGQSD